MSIEAEPMQPFEQPKQPEVPQLEIKRTLGIQSVAVLDKNNPEGLYELFPVGKALEIDSEASLHIRFTPEKPNETGRAPVTVDWMAIKGEHDHMRIDGESTVRYAIAPQQNQYELRAFSAHMGIPGMITPGKDDDTSPEICTIKYRGSTVGNMLYQVLENSELVSLDQLADIEKRLKGNKDNSFNNSVPLLFGRPLRRTVEDIYDSYMLDSIEKQTGQRPTSFEAQARFGVLYDRTKGITGILLTQAEDGINRIHDLGQFGKDTTRSSRQRSEQIPYEEILTRWLAVMESPQRNLNFFFRNHLVRSDLFTVIRNRMRLEQGEDLPPLQMDVLEAMSLYGFSIDAKLPYERSQLIYDRVQQPAIQELLNK